MSDTLHHRQTFRVSLEGQCRIREAQALSRLDGKRGTFDAMIRRVLGVYCAKARRRLRAKGKDVDGVLSRLRAGSKGVSKPFAGIPKRLPPVSRRYEE